MTPKLSPAQAFPGFTQTPSAHWTRPVQVPRSHPTHPRLCPLLPQTCPLPTFTPSRVALQVRKQGPSGPSSGPCPINHSTSTPPPPPQKDTHTSHPRVLRSIFPGQPKGHFQRAAPARSLLPTSSPPCSPARRSRSAQSPHAFRMRSQLLHLVKKGSALPLPNLHAHTQCASDG